MRRCQYATFLLMTVSFGAIESSGQSKNTPPAGTLTPRQWVESPKHGQVTLGTPKVWRFDHVFSTIDGMLRDVDAVTMKALTDLDPNAANQSAMDILVQTFRLAGGFNAASGASNAINLEQARGLSSLQTQQTQDLATSLAMRNRNLTALQASQFQTYTTLQNLMLSRQTDLLGQLFTLQDQRLKTPAGTDTKDLDAQIASVQAQLTDLKTNGGATLSQITALQSAQTAGSPPAPAPLLPAGATGTNLILTPGTAVLPTIGTPTTEESKGLAALADTANKSLQALGAGLSLPATKRMDNFITLLHERLSRELAVNVDDASLQRTLYLAQFDVGVFPYPKSKDEILQVTLDFYKGSDSTRAYDLYPGQSAYNITQFFGRSTRTGIAGAFQFLSGFGLSAEYQRQRDQARGSLTQSVYIAGIGAGTSQFGWFFGAAPEDKALSPGNRQVYALLSVPCSEDDGRAACLDKHSKATASVRWTNRNNGPSDSEAAASLPLTLPLKDTEPKALEIERIAYKTTYTKDHFDPAKEREDCNGAIPPEFSSIEVMTRTPFDPDLKLTVNGFLLPRLRDFKGRATGATRTQLGPTGAAFGLTEIDTFACSHWIALSPRSMLLRISRARAGEETFPQIRFLTDSSKDGPAATKGLLAAANQLGAAPPGTASNPGSGLLINGQTIHLAKELRAAAFPPLFSVVGSLEPSKVRVFLKVAAGSPAELQISLTDALTDRPPLDQSTQVYLFKSDRQDDSVTALACERRKALSCSLPLLDAAVGNLRVSIERPAKNGLTGFEASDLGITDAPAAKKLSVGDKWELVYSSPRWYEFSVDASDVEGAARLVAVGATPRDGLANCPEAGTRETPAVCSATEQQQDKARITVRVAAAWGGTLAASRMKLALQAQGDPVKLPSLADVLLPKTTAAQASTTGYVLRGVNYGHIGGVALRGVGDAAEPCEDGTLRIPAGLGNGIVTFNVPKKVDPGIYGVAFLMDASRPCVRDSYLDALDAQGAPLFVELKPPAKEKPEPKPGCEASDDPAKPCPKPANCCTGTPAIVQYFGPGDSAKPPKANQPAPPPPLKGEAVPEADKSPYIFAPPPPLESKQKQSAEKKAEQDTLKLSPVQ